MRLAKMNLAIHFIEGTIIEDNIFFKSPLSDERDAAQVLHSWLNIHSKNFNKTACPSVVPRAFSRGGARGSSFFGSIL